MKGYLEIILAFCLVIAAQGTQYDEKIFEKVVELERKVDLLAQNVNKKLCSKCAVGWTYYDGSCYMIEENNLPFGLAKAECEKRNAYLVHINNADENKFLTSYLKSKSKGYNFWIGLADAIKEGDFKWIGDKSAPTFENWAPNQPDNFMNIEDCVHLITGRNYEWNDRRCTDRLKFVCEQKITG